jgi:heme ABC exporter ATP-binding subunit CcmA
MTEESENQFVIELTDVQKSFGYHRVLSGINLKLTAGEHLVIIGRNGCGKTTLINIIATLLQPTRGKIKIDGLDTKKQAARVRGKLGFVSHNSMLYNDLTVKENLLFYGRMYSLTGLERRISELVARLELSKWADRRINELSRGTQQRTAIARAILHKPRVLLLDEPESGLDPGALTLLESIIAEQSAEGCTIIATSHNLDFALKTSNRLTILNKGRFVYEAESGKIDLSTLQTTFKSVSGVNNETRG